MLLSSHPFFKLCALWDYTLSSDVAPFLVKENNNGFIHLNFPKNGKLEKHFPEDLKIFLETIQYSKIWNKQMNEA